MKNSLISLILISCNLSAQQFNFTSVTTGGSSGNSSRCVDVVLDGGPSNLFSVGVFKGNVDFNADPAQSTFINASQQSMFIQCTDPGNPEVFQPLVWAKAIIPNVGSTITPTAICLGEQINVFNTNKFVYIVGSFTGTIDFDPGVAITNLTSGGASDAFVLKLDNLGGFVWVKKIGGNSNDYITAASYSGALNIVGTFKGTVDLNPNAGVLNVTANGANSDCFFEQIANNGNMNWGKTITGIETEGPNTIYSEGTEIVIAGSYKNTVDFNPSAATNNLTSVSDGCFIAKYDNLGNYIWVTGQANATSTSGIDYTTITDICKFNNNYYACGINWELIVFNTQSGTQIGFTPFANNADFILKLDNNGSGVWIKAIDNPSGTPQSQSNPWSIHVTPNVNSTTGEGFVYIIGNHFGQTDFDPGVGVAQLPLGQDGEYVAKYNTNGLFQFVRLIEKAGWGSQTKGYVHFNHPSQDAVYFGGSFTGTQDFDFSPSTNNRTSIGASDFYLLKILVNQ